MKAEEIMHVLRLVALGRINTPEQMDLCERLEKLFARECQALPVEPQKVEEPQVPDAETQIAKAKRAKKAD